MIIITPATMDLYHAWVKAAVADPQCERFFWMNGVLSWRVACADSEWDRITFVNTDATALGEISFDRYDGTATIGVAAIGTGGERAARAASALRAVGLHCVRRPIRRVFTGIAVTNEPSMRLNRRVFGEPYGLSPETAWDGHARAWVDRALFSASLSVLAEWLKVEPSKEQG